MTKYRSPVNRLKRSLQRTDEKFNVYWHVVWILLLRRRPDLSNRFIINEFLNAVQATLKDDTDPGLARL